MIHYKTFLHQNSKEWVTFVHGFGGNMSFWNEQIIDFQKHFNLLIIDLRGHGLSKNLSIESKYSIELFANDILEVMEHLKIEKSHFVGLSFGSIIINEFEKKYPSRVSKIVFTGAILKFNTYLWFLLNVGRIARSFIGYNYLLKVFAKIVMNTNNQDKMMFYVKKEGKSLGQSEFNKWYEVVPSLQKKLIELEAIDTKIEKLYIMGEEDAMFLPFTKISSLNKPNSEIIIVENCGHIVNLEKPDFFNSTALNFLMASNF